MDPAAIAAEVDVWLAANWDPDRPLVEWRRLLVAAGWAAPSWPRARGGRGLPAWADEVVADALQRAGAVGLPVGPAMLLAAPTLLAHGSDELQDRLLPPLLTGEHTWCQLFSEPGAGSDLAGLTTTAARDGDRWIVHGQKVWTTSAHHADMAMLLARTDWGAPKHRGLTYFAFPMHQDGIEVRPLRQMNGHASFNEVFITDAVVGDADVVGEVGEGWRVALTTLAHERRFGGLRLPPGDACTKAGRTVREAQEEAIEHLRTYRWYPQRAGRPDLVAARARERGRAAEPIIRQAVAGVHALARASQWTAAASGGGPRPRPAARPRRIAGQAGGERAGPGGGPGPQRGGRTPGHAHGRRRRRDGRRGHRVGAGAVDRGRYRRGAAQHHRREGARLAQGALTRSRPSFPRRPPQPRALTPADPPLVVLCPSRTQNRGREGQRMDMARNDAGMELTGTGVWNASLRYGDPAQSADAAAELEELGYTATWLPDVGGDVFAAVGNLLGATDHLVVATGILNLWLHEPADAG